MDWIGSFQLPLLWYDPRIFRALSHPSVLFHGPPCDREGPIRVRAVLRIHSPTFPFWFGEDGVRSSRSLFLEIDSWNGSFDILVFRLSISSDPSKDAMENGFWIVSPFVHVAVLATSTDACPRPSHLPGPVISSNRMCLSRSLSKCFTQLPLHSFSYSARFFAHFLLISCPGETCEVQPGVPLPAASAHL